MPTAVRPVWGQTRQSLCRDWKTPAIDWGDQDLALALDLMARQRPADLVVFGHMHQTQAQQWFTSEPASGPPGTAYVNAACVPRLGVDQSGRSLMHLSWAEFVDARLTHLSHRWYSSDAALIHEEVCLAELRRMLIYVCCSSHGFGHAARDAAVLRNFISFVPTGGWCSVPNCLLPSSGC